MSRKYIDCREFPSDMNCSVTLIADTERELLDAAVQHAITVHGHPNSPDLREMLKGAVHEGQPPDKLGSSAA